MGNKCSTCCRCACCTNGNKSHGHISSAGSVYSKRYNMHIIMFFIWSFFGVDFIVKWFRNEFFTWFFLTHFQLLHINLCNLKFDSLLNWLIIVFGLCNAFGVDGFTHKMWWHTFNEATLLIKKTQIFMWNYKQRLFLHQIQRVLDKAFPCWITYKTSISYYSIESLCKRRSKRFYRRLIIVKFMQTINS